MITPSLSMGMQRIIISYEHVANMVSLTKNITNDKFPMIYITNSEYWTQMTFISGRLQNMIFSSD